LIVSVATVAYCSFRVAK